MNTFELILDCVAYSCLGAMMTKLVMRYIFKVKKPEDSLRAHVKFLDKHIESQNEIIDYWIRSAGRWRKRAWVQHGINPRAFDDEESN